VKFPLTEFLINLMRCKDTAALQRADPAKLAARWGIREKDARELLWMELQNRGVKQEDQAADRGSCQPDTRRLAQG
jgi:hypothetical protein